MSNVINDGQEKVEVFILFSWYTDDFTSDFSGISLKLEKLMDNPEDWTQINESCWKDVEGNRIERFLLDK